MPRIELVSLEPQCNTSCEYALRDIPQASLCNLRSNKGEFVSYDYNFKTKKCDCDACVAKEECAVPLVSNETTFECYDADEFKKKICGMYVNAPDARMGAIKIYKMLKLRKLLPSEKVLMSLKIVSGYCVNIQKYYIGPYIDECNDYATIKYFN